MDEYVAFKNPNTGASDSTPINLLTIVRNFERIDANKDSGAVEALSLENYLTCFYVQLNLLDKCLLISTAEHSLVDELRKDFHRPMETVVKIPLPEQLFHFKQWNHLAVVLSRAIIKQSQVLLLPYFLYI